MIDHKRAHPLSSSQSLQLEQNHISCEPSWVLPLQYKCNLATFDDIENSQGLLPLLKQHPITKNLKLRILPIEVIEQLLFFNPIKYSFLYLVKADVVILILKRKYKFISPISHAKHRFNLRSILDFHIWRSLRRVRLCRGSMAYVYYSQLYLVTVSNFGEFQIKGNTLSINLDYYLFQRRGQNLSLVFQEIQKLKESGSRFCIRFHIFFQFSASRILLYVYVHRDIREHQQQMIQLSQALHLYCRCKQYRYIMSQVPGDYFGQLLSILEWY